MPIRWSGNQIDPISIILVTKGTKGDKLLFKYPFFSEVEEEKSPRDDAADAKKAGLSLIASNGSRQDSRGAKSSLENLLFLSSAKTTGKQIGSPYSLRREDYKRFLAWKPEFENKDSLLEHGSLTKLPDELMAYQFTVKQELAEQRFEVKINDVRFVGFPILTPQPDFLPDSSRSSCPGSGDEECPDILLFSVVIAVHASADKSIVKQYQDLSKRIALAIEYEEGRCGYLNRQAKLMNESLEEAQQLPESDREAGSPYCLMLEKSGLARALKLIFDEITERGSFSLRLNDWVQVSFCLPQKVYERIGIPPCCPSVLEDALDCLRPYHSVLLVEDVNDIISALPVDSSSSLIRFIRYTTPLKSIQTMASDLDLPLPQVCLLVRHLVVWGKGIPVFPLCESNVYAVSESANIHSFTLNENFAEMFPGRTLLGVLAEFSPSLTLGEFTGSLHLDPLLQKERVRMVMWLMRRCILVQLHTFVYLCPSEVPEKPPVDYIASRVNLDSLAAALIRKDSQAAPTLIIPNNIRGNNLVSQHPDLKTQRSRSRSPPANPPVRKTSLAASHRVPPVPLSPKFKGNESNSFMDRIGSSIPEESDQISPSPEVSDPISKATSKVLGIFKDSFEVLRKSNAPEWVVAGIREMVRDIIEWDVGQGLLPVRGKTETSIAENSLVRGLQEDIKIFARLFKYCDGNHHLEEIMYRENMRRNECQRILDVFSSLLTTASRQDKLTIMLQNHTAC